MNIKYVINYIHFPGPHLSVIMNSVYYDEHT